MTARPLAGAAACALLIPLISALPPGPPAQRTRWNEGATASASRDPQTAAVPVRAGRLERLDARQGLEAAIAAAQAAGGEWIAWSVRAARHRVDRSGSDSLRGRTGVCVLREDGTIDPEGWERGPAERMTLIARTRNRTLAHVAFTSDSCVLDAGPRTVYWLDGVVPAQSVRLLAGLVRQTDDEEDEREGRRMSRDGLLAAVALHDDPEADVSLRGFVQAGQPRALRRKAAFWLGAVRGEAGAATVEQLARNDGDAEFREHLTFVLTLTGERGIDTLIDLARTDRNAGVRRQALFWLGQKAGDRAIGEIERAVDDPDSKIRTQAVFALSRLPADEGVPRLIAVARTHRDPHVRKQAMFWLGQSGDPRALQFFEDVLRSPTP
ncbi:MAG TPA: HEAT repeat domain-containing protein [Vicinamibacterales bacterium]